MTTIKAVHNKLDEMMFLPGEVEDVLGLEYSAAERKKLETIPFDLKTLVDFSVGPKSDSACLLFPGFPISSSELTVKFPALFNVVSLSGAPEQEMSAVAGARWYFISTELVTKSTPLINNFFHLPKLPEVVLMALLFNQLFDFELWDEEVALCAPIEPQPIITLEGPAVKYPTVGSRDGQLVIFGDEADAGSNVGFALSRRLGT